MSNTIGKGERVCPALISSTYATFPSSSSSSHSHSHQQSDHEILKGLESSDDNTKISSMKKILRRVLAGEDFPKALMPVIKYTLNTRNHELKKLVLLFWESIERTNPTTGALLPEMILVCNALKNNLEHANEYIRGVSLRFLTRLNEREIFESLVPSVTLSLKHSHSYVRKNAIIALYSIYASCPDLIPDATERTVEFLISEYNTSAKRNALLFLINGDTPKAVEYLHSLLPMLQLTPEPIVLLLLRLIRTIVRQCAATPNAPIAPGLPVYSIAKSLYIKALHKIILSNSNSQQIKGGNSGNSTTSSEDNISSPTLLFEASSTLLALTQAPTATKASISALIHLLANPGSLAISTRSMVLDRLQFLANDSKFHSLLHSTVVQILNASFSAQNTSISLRALQLTLPLVTSVNAETYVGILKKELLRLEKTCSSGSSGSGSGSSTTSSSSNSSTSIGSISIYTSTNTNINTPSNDSNTINESSDDTHDNTPHKYINISSSPSDDQALCVAIIKALYTLSLQFSTVIPSVVTLLARYIYIDANDREQGNDSHEKTIHDFSNPNSTALTVKGSGINIAGDTNTISLLISQLIRDVCYKYPHLRYTVISQLLSAVPHIASSEIFRCICWTISEYISLYTSFNTISSINEASTGGVITTSQRGGSKRSAKLAKKLSSSTFQQEQENISLLATQDGVLRVQQARHQYIITPNSIQQLFDTLGMMLSLTKSFIGNSNPIIANHIQTILGTSVVASSASSASSTSTLGHELYRSEEEKFSTSKTTKQQGLQVQAYAAYGSVTSNSTVTSSSNISGSNVNTTNPNTWLESLLLCESPDFFTACVYGVSLCKIYLRLASIYRVITNSTSTANLTTPTGDRDNFLHLQNILTSQVLHKYQAIILYVLVKIVRLRPTTKKLDEDEDGFATSSTSTSASASASTSSDLFDKTARPVLQIDSMERLISCIRILLLEQNTNPEAQQKYTSLVSLYNSGSIPLTYAVQDATRRENFAKQKSLLLDTMNTSASGAGAGDGRSTLLSSQQNVTNTIETIAQTIKRESILTNQFDGDDVEDESRGSELASTPSSTSTSTSKDLLAVFEHNTTFNIEEKIIFRQLRAPVFKPLDPSTQECYNESESNPFVADENENILLATTGQSTSGATTTSMSMSLTSKLKSKSKTSSSLQLAAGASSLQNSILSRTHQLSGYCDHIYAEAVISLVDSKLTMEFTVTNQTDMVLQNVTIELLPTSDIKVISTPAPFSLQPTTLGAQPQGASGAGARATTATATGNVHKCSCVLQVISTESGSINGTIVFENKSGLEKTVILLAPIFVDISEYIRPATCTDAEFRSMWAAFEWENKIQVNTTLQTLQEYLAIILQATKMTCLVIPVGVASCNFLTINLFANSIFGEEALANVSIEKNTKTGKIAGYIRLRSKTQGIALGLGDKITKAQTKSNQMQLKLQQQQQQQQQQQSK